MRTPMNDDETPTTAPIVIERIDHALSFLRMTATTGNEELDCMILDAEQRLRRVKAELKQREEKYGRQGLRHQIKGCPIVDNVTKLHPRDWHCCECGWPNRPCRELCPELRVGETTASTPRCGDDATPYLTAIRFYD